jgi:hypothetical protein
MYPESEGAYRTVRCEACSKPRLLTLLRSSRPGEFKIFLSRVCLPVGGTGRGAPGVRVTTTYSRSNATPTQPYHHNRRRRRRNQKWQVFLTINPNHPNHSNHPNNHPNNSPNHPKNIKFFAQREFATVWRARRSRWANCCVTKVWRGLCCCICGWRYYCAWSPRVPGR